MRTLPALLSLPEDAPPERVRARVEAWLAARGCARPAPGADPDDPRVGLWWLMRMAWRTHRRAREPWPPVDPARLAHLEALMETRPGRDEAHGQLHVDAASTLRRAQAVARVREAHPGPVLAVGDDDAVSLALHLLSGGPHREPPHADENRDDTDHGDTDREGADRHDSPRRRDGPGRAVGRGASEVHAVDIDPRVLAFLRGSSEGAIATHAVDVLGGPVPPALRGRFAVAVTDPFRDLDGGLGFLSFAAATLRRRDARLLWVDHPDWNFEHGLVRQTMAKLGWTVEETLEDLHAYPLTPAAVRLDALEAAWDLDAGWLAELVAQTAAWSHLHVLRRDR